MSKSTTTLERTVRPEALSRVEVLRKLQAVVAARPDFSPRYEHAKHITRAFRRPAFYEVSTRCNLFCEGCYYFENAGQDREPPDPNLPLSQWEAFFATEAERGVSMAYFLGAEPALHQERLLAAANHFPNGNIGTNGTIRIRPEVPYRIAVSVWAADEETDRQLRGAHAFRKALRNYQGDPRAIMLFTVTAWNIDEVPTIARMCEDHGLDLTFNLYSPTNAFNSKIVTGAPNDDAFFRKSSAEDSPIFGSDDLERARDTLDQVMEDFPRTVIYSHNYNSLVTSPGCMYELDSDGAAVDCGSRIDNHMHYYRTNLARADVKCCTPGVDCSSCRMYSGGWSSVLEPKSRDVESEQTVEKWLEMMETIGRIFLMNPVGPARSERGSQMVAAVA